MFTFTAYKVELNGTLSNKEHLNFDELDYWMESKHGKFATVSIVRDQDSKRVTYTDNGVKFVLV